jgi:hypothetical protein
MSNISVRQNGKLLLWHEITNSKRSSAMRSNFNKPSAVASWKEVIKLWRILHPETFPDLRSFAQKTLRGFEIAYICEKAYAATKVIKNKQKFTGFSHFSCNN